MNIVVGVPLPPDYKADARTISIVEGWAKLLEVHVIYKASPSPEEGRDKIVADVMNMVPRPTHVLFVDADVIPRPKTLTSLVSQDKDIVTGCVPICQKGIFKWNVSIGDGFDAVNIKELPLNPFKVKSCGFGVVLVKTEVFDRLEWPYWKNEYKPGLRVLGEDIYFSQKAIDAGFDIWCDPKVKCDHATRSSYLSIIRNLLSKE